MSATTYFVIGAVMAAYLGAHDDIEQGDWAKAVALIVLCALWPVAIGLGLGLTIASIIRGIRSIVTKSRAKLA